MIAEALYYQLDGSSCIGHKDEVPVFRIGVEESKGPFPDGIHAVSGQGRRR